MHPLGKSAWIFLKTKDRITIRPNNTVPRHMPTEYHTTETLEHPCPLLLYSWYVGEIINLNIYQQMKQYLARQKERIFKEALPFLFFFTYTIKHSHWTKVGFWQAWIECMDKNLKHSSLLKSLFVQTVT